MFIWINVCIQINKRESNTEFHTKETYSLPIVMQSTILAVKYLENEVP